MYFYTIMKNFTYCRALAKGAHHTHTLISFRPHSLSLLFGRFLINLVIDFVSESACHTILAPKVI